ncbi:hypothetical protein ACEWY4_022873 [Coilia grayii]|uniref:Uncharacterized protein n=1 Tax=Coilia grayii TaxID=363190 RepID=A0ABD1J1E1_9TELE
MACCDRDADPNADAGEPMERNQSSVPSPSSALRGTVLEINKVLAESPRLEFSLVSEAKRQKSCKRQENDCKYVYQPMTRVGQLPSTTVPLGPSDPTDTIDLSISLTERFLRIAPWFQPPPCPESPRYCVISDLFIDDYVVKRINGKMCYVQRPPPMMPLAPPHMPPHPPHHPQQCAHPHPHLQQCGHSHPHLQQCGHSHPHHYTQPPTPPPSQPHPPTPCPANQDVQEEQEAPLPLPPTQSCAPMEKAKGPKMDHCSSPSTSEDSGINAIGGNFLESCEEDSCEEEGEEVGGEGVEEEGEEEDRLSSDGKSSPASWDHDECTLLSPSKSLVEIIENIETTV